MLIPQGRAAGRRIRQPGQLRSGAGAAGLDPSNSARWSLDHAGAPAGRELAAGYAGLEDGIDNHWGKLFKAAVLSTLLSVGAEAGTSQNENNLAQAVRAGAANSFSQTGQQIVEHELNIQPTLTIRPGFPVRVMVTHDLVLERYRG